MSYSFSPDEWVETLTSNALFSKGAVLQVIRVYPSEASDDSDLILAGTSAQVVLYEPQELKLWEAPL